MFLHVEWKRIEEAANGTLSRDRNGHCFAENVRENGQEDDRDEDGLWLEVENFLKDSTEARQAKPCLRTLV